MKAFLSTILIFSLLICFCSCDSISIFTKNLSGVYIGDAEVLIEETQFWPDSSPVTITLIDTIIEETITVSDVDKANHVYSIDRASSFFSSFYDFKGEITLDEDYRYFISYVYDRNWSTEIQFDTKDDSFEATMLVKDVFESYREDSLGQPIYYYVLNREYRVKAFK